MPDASAADIFILSLIDIFDGADNSFDDYIDIHI